MQTGRKGAWGFGFGFRIFTLQIEECRLRNEEAAKSRNSEANLSNGAGEGALLISDLQKIGGTS